MKLSSSLSDLSWAPLTTHLHDPWSPTAQISSWGLVHTLHQSASESQTSGLAETEPALVMSVCISRKLCLGADAGTPVWAVCVPSETLPTEPSTQPIFWPVQLRIADKKAKCLGYVTDCLTECDLGQVAFTVLTVNFFCYRLIKRVLVITAPPASGRPSHPSGLLFMPGVRY